MTTRYFALGVYVAAAVTLAGCGTESNPAPTDTVAATAESTAAEPVPTDAEAKTADPSRNSGVTLTDLRIGHHDGFDRVVYEFGGTGAPGWDVSYVEKAVQDASGKDIAVAGSSILEVRITGSAYPFDSGVTEYSGPDPLTDPSASAVAEVQIATLFEGVTQSFVGVNGDRPAFAVRALTEPTRLVVDIAN